MRLPDPIERAWRREADDLATRVWATRRTAYEHGVWSVDGAARAVLATPGVSLESAEAAVALAPDLPLAHMEWARASWLAGESPLASLRALGSALLSFGRHPEAALWFGGSLSALLALALVAASALLVGAAGVFALPHAAHDLGDLVSSRMPGFGRAALLGALLLTPVAVGEGVAGLLVALLAVATVYATARQRVALACASLALLAGAFPVAELAGRTLGALADDAVVRAALATNRGLVLPDDEARLEAAASHDPLAREALARVARRRGHLGRADALYQSLLAERPDDRVLLTNAANLRLQLGHMESAFALYERALAHDDTALVLFNLSQAYGRDFQVEELTRTLERAQARDGDQVAELTRLQGAEAAGFVVDFPLSQRALLEAALFGSDGRAWAEALRRPWAPGRAGQSPLALCVALAAALLLGGAVAARLRASGWCARCHERVCPRCHENARDDVCGSCYKLYHQPELTDRDLRVARIEALRERNARLDRLASAVSCVVPGVAGLLAGRPLLGLWGALCFCVALGALLGRNGAVPDPLVAGGAGTLAFGCVAVLAAVAYATSVGSSLSARRRLG